MRRTCRWPLPRGKALPAALFAASPGERVEAGRPRSRAMPSSIDPRVRTAQHALKRSLRSPGGLRRGRAWRASWHQVGTSRSRTTQSSAFAPPRLVLRTRSRMAWAHARISPVLTAFLVTVTVLSYGLPASAKGVQAEGFQDTATTHRSATASVASSTNASSARPTSAWQKSSNRLGTSACR